MPRALFVPLFVAMLATSFGTRPVLAATTDTWTDGTGNWSTAANWTNTSSGHTVPAAGDTVNIGPFGDGVARTVTYDYTGAAVILAQLAVDLTGAGATTTTLSMSANNLTSSIEDVGYTASGGRGTFNQSGGTNTIAAGTGYLDVGVFSGATGTYNLSNTGVLVANTPEYIGDIGVGFFNQNGGSNTINNLGVNLYLGYSQFGNGSTSGTYTLMAGDLTVIAAAGLGSEYVGYNHSGTFNQSGGTNTTQQLNLGRAAGSSGMYTLSGGSLSTNNEYIGSSGSATFNHNGGTNATTGYLIVGNGFGPTSPSATYTLSGTGALYVGVNEIVGLTGTANLFNQTGGTQLISGELDLGDNPGASGTYTLSGGSASVIANGVYLGGTSAGAVGTGVVNISGTGALSTPSLTIYNTSGSSVNLSGGTINTSSLNINGAPSNFNWTSGELNLTANVTWDSAAGPISTSAAFGPALMLGNNQTLMVTGNETLGGSGSFALTLNSGSTHNVTGNLTISPTGTLTQNPGSTLNAATITQAGGTVNGILQNQGNFIYQSGLFTGRLLNQGMFNLDANFTASNGVENDNSMTLNIGQTITVNGAGLENVGTLILSGGVISGSGPALNDFGGTLQGYGVINQNFMNSGNLIVSGQLRLNAGFANESNGVFVVEKNVTAIANGTSTNAGEIQLGTEAATLTGTGALANTGLIRGDGIISLQVTNNFGGEIRAENGSRLKFTGTNGTNLGTINLQGGTAEFTQPLTNGANTGQIVGRGTLIVDGTGLTNNGNIAFSSGIADVFGDVHNSTGSTTQGITISGQAQVTFWDDVTNGVTAGDGTLFKVSSDSSATFFGTYSGTGVSGTGNVYYEADISPGFSPASVNYGGNVFLDSTSRLIMQLGGTSVGSQYDKVKVAGQLALGGTLDVELINSFSPTSGNKFDILDWGSLGGHFGSVSLPALSAGLAWDSAQLYTTGTLEVVNVNLLPGDFNRDGHVDAADILPAMKALTNPTGYEAQYGVSAADLQIIGDVNGDTQFTNADLQALLDYLKDGGGSISTVPEPSTFVLAAFGFLSLLSCARQRRRCQCDSRNDWNGNLGAADVCSSGLVSPATLGHIEKSEQLIYA